MDAASLHTDNLHFAHRMASAIRADTVSVNCFFEVDNAVPFGSFKQSGFGGRANGLFARESYTKDKTIWIQTKQ